MDGDRRFRVSLATVLALVALIGLVIRCPLALVPAMPAAVDGVIRRAGRAARTTVWPVLCSVYLPCLIGLLPECDHCRETWAQVWPVTLGLGGFELARALLGFQRPGGEASLFAIAGLLTLGWIGLAAWVASRGRIAFWTALGVSATASTLVAVSVYQAIRS